MRPADIVEGETYRGRDGRERVIDDAHMRGSRVRWRAISHPRFRERHEGVCRRTTFARWAVERVDGAAADAHGAYCAAVGALR